MGLAESWSDVHKWLLEFVRGDPWGASAELNAMRPWLDAGGMFVEGVVLFPTLTGGGLLAGRVLERFLREEYGLGVRVVPVDGFQHGVWPGIVGLLRRVGSVLAELRGEPGRLFMLNATGGFKPESAFMMLGGLTWAYGRSMAYYIHEYHREPAVIPLVTGEPLERGARLVVRAKQGGRPGRWVRIPREWLDEHTRWLETLAFAAQPLEVSRLEESQVVLAEELAQTIEALAYA